MMSQELRAWDASTGEGAMVASAFWLYRSVVMRLRRAPSNGDLDHDAERCSEGKQAMTELRREENATAVTYLERYGACLDDPYHAILNPEGYVALCVSENKLVMDLLTERFMEAAPAAFSDPQAYVYHSHLGMPLAREAAACFLARRFLGVDAPRPMTLHRTFPLGRTVSSPIDSSHVAIGTGAVALLQNVFQILGRPGDACLIPAPYYAAFERAMQLAADIVPVPIHQGDPVAGPTRTELNLAFNNARSRGLKPKFLLITNPNNPLGTIYRPDVLSSMVEWARSHHLHTIVDEIYALSTHYYHQDEHPHHADEEAKSKDEENANSGTGQILKTQRHPNDGKFVSILRVLQNNLGDDVHMLWAVSKDLGASGFRLGLLYSQNASLLQKLATCASFSPVSGPLQRLLADWWTDDDAMDRFLTESNQRLRSSYQLCVQKLEARGIPHVRAAAGLFVYADFSSVIQRLLRHGDCSGVVVNIKKTTPATAPGTRPSVSWEEEDWFSEYLFQQARVVLTPGQAQRDPRPGWFRICYARDAPEVVEVALDRVLRCCRLGGSL